MQKSSNLPPYVAHEAVGGLYTLAEIKIAYQPKNVYVGNPAVLDMCLKGIDVATMAYQLYDPADLAMGCKLLAVFMDKRRKTIAYRFMDDVNMYEPDFFQQASTVVSIYYGTFADSVSLVLNMPDGRVKPSGDLEEKINDLNGFMRKMRVNLDDFVIISPDGETFYSSQAKQEGSVWNP